MVPGGLLAHALPEHAARDDRGSAGLAASSGRSTNVAHEVGLYMIMIIDNSGQMK